MTHKDNSTALGIEKGLHEHPILSALCLLPFPTACVSLYYNLESSGVAGLLPREMLIGGAFDVLTRKGPTGPLLGRVCSGWLE